MKRFKPLLSVLVFSCTFLTGCIVDVTNDEVSTQTPDSKRNQTHPFRDAGKAKLVYDCFQPEAAFLSLTFWSDQSIVFNEEIEMRPRWGTAKGQDIRSIPTLKDGTRLTLAFDDGETQVITIQKGQKNDSHWYISDPWYMVCSDRN